MTGCSEILGTRFLLSLFRFPSLSSPCGDGAKTHGAVCAPMGGSDPTGHFRDRRAERRGRSRPTQCFGPVAFLCRLFRISLFILGLSRFPGDAQTERPAERFPLHPVHPDSSSLARKSGCFGTRYASKYTFRFGALAGNSARTSASVMRPAFQFLKRVSK